MLVGDFQNRFICRVSEQLMLVFCSEAKSHVEKRMEEWRKYEKWLWKEAIQYVLSLFQTSGSVGCDGRWQLQEVRGVSEFSNDEEIDDEGRGSLSVLHSLPRGCLSHSSRSEG